MYQNWTNAFPDEDIQTLLSMGYTQFMEEYANNQKWTKIRKFWIRKMNEAKLADAKMILQFAVLMVTLIVSGWIYGLCLQLKQAKETEPNEYSDLDTESDSEDEY